jgi:predicted transcriptional regulator
MSETPPADPTAPFEAQRAMHELLSQETRYHILQTILGHPTHLASLAELGYYTQKSESAVLDQLGKLIDHGVLTAYAYEGREGTRDQPSKFYGLTERGVVALEEFKYLRGVPVLRAIHEKTIKPERIQRHEDAPRPTLPEAVARALDVDSDDVESSELEESTRPPIFADGATTDEDGAFDELFD